MRIIEIIGMGVLDKDAITKEKLCIRVELVATARDKIYRVVVCRTKQIR